MVIAKTSVWPVSWDQNFKREAFVVFDSVARHLGPGARREAAAASD